MVTMIPSDIQVPITLVIGTSIIIAISPTVNSVTLIVLLPSSIALALHQILTVRISLSLLYFAALDLPTFLPCSFSKVSRI
jgi:hypothetical protein